MDGRPDLAYTALRDETFPLYRNRGSEFDEVTGASRLAVLTRSMSGWGIAFADLDNDGLKDLAVARSDAVSASGGKGASAKGRLPGFAIWAMANSPPATDGSRSSRPCIGPGCRRPR